VAGNAGENGQKAISVDLNRITTIKIRGEVGKSISGAPLLVHTLPSLKKRKTDIIHGAVNVYCWRMAGQKSSIESRIRILFRSCTKLNVKNERSLQRRW
jgi:hypothetical protein